MDFYILEVDDIGNITTAKRNIADMDGMMTLDAYLRKLGVSEGVIGSTIEKLEAIPYGAGKVQIVGGRETLSITQKV